MGKPLLFNGKPFDPNPPKEIDLKIKQWLDDNYGVYTKTGLSQTGVAGEKSIFAFSRNPRYRDYSRIRPGTKVPLLVGSPAALKEYETALAKQLTGAK